MTIDLNLKDIEHLDDEKIDKIVKFLKEINKELETDTIDNTEEFDL